MTGSLIVNATIATLDATIKSPNVAAGSLFLSHNYSESRETYFRKQGHKIDFGARKNKAQQAEDKSPLVEQTEIINSSNNRIQSNMKLFTVAAALALMATLASADPEWRARFYARTDFKGGANVDVRGPVGSTFTTTVGGVPTTCGNIPGSGDQSFQFEDANPPNNDKLTVYPSASCAGASTVYTGATSVATLSPTARSFKVNG
ncbi:hypothetical protein PQX77_019841 [Marasmius sp. AFHP31]|nr:hypothetical protein PQX77_019841 [Marasmius sp. AFHP31]